MDNVGLTPAEERLLELLVAYDESLSAGITPAEFPLAPAASDPELADQFLRGRQLLDLLAAFQPAASDSPSASKVDSVSISSVLQEMWKSLPDGGGALPRQLGRFVILRELGRGGHGVVLLAHDPILKRHVALKLPRPENLMSTSLRRRFVHEAQTAARLTHPNLVSVYEVGEIGPICYIASAYCAGPTLAEWLRARSTDVSPRLAARIIEQLAHALQYAHEQNVLHRDLKPSNVLLEPLVQEATAAAPDDGLSFVPKVADFGLAKFASEAEERSQTRTGSVLGTPAYMSPEQAEGRLAEVGPTTDVYGLGTILYELLTRAAPFSGKTDLEILHKLLVEEPTPLWRLRRGVPADLEAICRKCLEKAPAARYPSCAALAADLQRFLTGLPTHARPLSVPQQLDKWARRRPAVAALIVVSTLAAATIVAGSALYTMRLGQALAVSEERRQEADEQRTLAERHREQAEVNLDLAEKSGLEMSRQQENTNQFVYATRTRQAYQALSEGDIGQVEQVLDEYKTGTRWANLRGFAWHYLKRLLHNGQQVLRDHQGEVYGVAFSRDGRVLVSGGDDGAIRVWDPASGRQLQSIRAHDNCTNDLAFSPDGQLLVSASCDDTLKLWDTSTWREVATIAGHDADVLCVAFSPDGRWLASGDILGNVFVWSVEKRQRLAMLPGVMGAGALHAVAWSPNSRTLAIAQAKHPIRLVEAETWKVVGEMSPGASTAIAFSPNGRLLASNASERIEIRDAASLELLATLPSHFGVIQRIVFSADSQQLFSCAENGLVRMWLLTPEGRVATGVARSDQQGTGSIRTFVGHNGQRVQNLALAPDGNTLASAGFDGTVHLWDLKTRGDSVPMLSCRLHQHDHLLSYRTRLTPDLARLFVVTDDFRVVEFDTQNGCEVSSRQIKPVRDHGFGFTPKSGALLAWRQADAALLIAPVGADDPMAFSTVLCGVSQQLAFSADGQYLAAAGRDGFIRVLDIHDRHERYVTQFTDQASIYITGQGVRIRLSDDGQWLAVANVHSGLIDLNTGIALDLPALREGVAGMTFSPDGHLLALRRNNGSVQLVDIAQQRTIQTLRFSSPTEAVALTSDNTTAAVATYDGHIVLCHAATGQELMSLLTYEGSVTQLQFSSDNSALAAVIVNPQTNEASLYVWSTRN